MVTRPRTVERHSVDNLLSQSYYTLNHVNADIMKAAHQTSARYPRGESEFNATGLTPYFTDIQPAPYVAESHLSLGLELRERKLIELNDTEFIIGDIVEVRLNGEAIREDGYVDIEALGSLTISGLDRYHTTQRQERMAYAKPDVAPNPLNLTDESTQKTVRQLVAFRDRRLLVRMRASRNF